MKEKMKIAVIGCGRFSQFFVPLFKAHKLVEEVYVCDLKRERAEEFATRFGVKIIDSFEEALASSEINALRYSLKDSLTARWRSEALRQESTFTALSPVLSR